VADFFQQTRLPDATTPNKIEEMTLGVIANCFFDHIAVCPAPDHKGCLQGQGFYVRHIRLLHVKV
jgi:hypothetical protein